MTPYARLQSAQRAMLAAYRAAVAVQNRPGASALRGDVKAAWRAFRRAADAYEAAKKGEAA